MFFFPGSFVDCVSILNQYCQKSRINVAKYSEAPGVQGGFGIQCFVKGQIFKTMKYCATKKEARHDAAMCALLGLNIPVGKSSFSLKISKIYLFICLVGRCREYPKLIQILVELTTHNKPLSLMLHLIVVLLYAYKLVFLAIALSMCSKISLFLPL